MWNFPKTAHLYLFKLSEAFHAAMNRKGNTAAPVDLRGSLLLGFANLCSFKQYSSLHSTSSPHNKCQGEAENSGCCTPANLDNEGLSLQTTTLFRKTDLSMNGSIHSVQNQCLPLSKKWLIALCMGGCVLSSNVNPV